MMRLLLLPLMVRRFAPGPSSITSRSGIALRAAVFGHDNLAAR